MQTIEHAGAATAFLADAGRATWHDETLWLVRTKRDRAAAAVPEWEQLRSQASHIKDHTLSHLHYYLQQFEANALKNGVQVHWAADAAEHNCIVHRLIKESGRRTVVKSKSMLTEECGLNDYLQQQNLQVTDTDLGEYIVQLRNEHPSHIVLPAIHLKKEDVSNTFHRHLHTEWGNSNPAYLAGAARAALRQRLLHAGIAITGVNFAVAETGSMVVCTNEGNADMGVHAAAMHIACMGIEKIIPATVHLPVFLRLLARSATGQPITTYTSHFTRPAKGRQLHVVIVDNGRSRQLGRPDFRSSLKCIRCAACFNTCPVYRRSGGHSYHSTVAGPIGSILNPNNDMRANADLPFASTLCGSCTHVCPVKINIHEQLWKWRQVLTAEGHTAAGKKWFMRLLAVIIAHPFLLRHAGRCGRWLMRRMPFMTANRFNAWHRQRSMPSPPKQSFSDWYKQNVCEPERKF